MAIDHHELDVYRRSLELLETCDEVSISRSSSSQAGLGVRNRHGAVIRARARWDFEKPPESRLVNVDDELRELRAQRRDQRIRDRWSIGEVGGHERALAALEPHFDPAAAVGAAIEVCIPLAATAITASPSIWTPRDFSISQRRS